MRRKTTLFGIGFLIITFFVLHIDCIKGPSEIEKTIHCGSAKAVPLNASNFDSLALDYGITSVVEFYSAGSPICTAMAWVIDCMAARSADTILFGAVNIDTDDALLIQYDIDTLPTYLFFHKSIQVAKRSYSAIAPGAYDSLTLILNDILAGRAVPVVLTSENFATLVAAADCISVVEFFSPHCGYCQAMEAPLSSLSLRFNNRALIGKVNVDEQDSLRSAYGVMSWPTLIFFAGGVEQSREIGYMPEDSLAARLDGLLLGTVY
jgi:thioredoxin 1